MLHFPALAAGSTGRIRFDTAALFIDRVIQVEIIFSSVVIAVMTGTLDRKARRCRLLFLLQWSWPSFAAWGRSSVRRGAGMSACPVSMPHNWPPSRALGGEVPRVLKLVDAPYDEANKQTTTASGCCSLNDKEEAYSSLGMHLGKCGSPLQFVGDMHVDHPDAFVYNHILFVVVAQLLDNE